MSLNRPHLLVPLANEQINGSLLTYAQVTVFEEDGVTPYQGTLYTTATGAETTGNPFAVAPALVDLYLDYPARVVFGYVTNPSAAVPMTYTHVIDVQPDGAQLVTSGNPLHISGGWAVEGVLSTDGTSAFWAPLTFVHQHVAIGGGTVRTGAVPLQKGQSAAFPDVTMIGSNTGAPSAAGYSSGATMLGYSVSASGRSAVAVGWKATAAELPSAPWTGGGVALGAFAYASASGVAIGPNSEGVSVAIGSSADDAAGGVALGTGSEPSINGVAIGYDTGSSSNGPAGSIGLGANAQYGLPSDASDTAVMLGPQDPTVSTAFTWANPSHSQSVSPLDEYEPTMQFTGKTVQLQSHLEWLLNAVGITVAGNARVGARTGTVGFYGSAGTAQGSVGLDEVCSGIPALDSLIYALRDLGLLKYRSEALMVYRAADLVSQFQDGDPVTSWPEHFGRDTATSISLPNTPAYDSGSGSYNNLASVVFTNGHYGRRALPEQQMRGANLLPSLAHVAIVANHNGDHFGNVFGQNEGLVNLGDGTNNEADNIATGVFGSDVWDANSVGHYERDGRDQTANLRAWDADETHVYQFSSPSVWPHAVPILGGPHDHPQSTSWDGWSGSIAEVVGMDSTWSLSDARSMSQGLMFFYGVDQDPDTLFNPAQEFLTLQYEPADNVYVFWSGDYDDYDDDFIGRVYGFATNTSDTIIDIPHCHFGEFANLDYSYRGSLVGGWGLLDSWSDYELVVTVRHGSYDDDGLTDTIIGTYALNNNLSWSTGKEWCDTGNKRCYIRHRETLEEVCTSDDHPRCHGDLIVKVYSTQSNGSLYLEDTVRLWEDNTFSARVRHAGHKVARIYTQEGALVGTTEWQERALPRTQVYATDDSERANADRAYTVESALTALAFMENDRSYWHRARHILIALQSVANSDGSLDQYYDAALPAQTPTTSVPVGVAGMAWTILAVLRYQERTGDTRFQAFASNIATYLISIKLPSNSIPTAPGSSTASTAENALCYFAMRDLGLALGNTNYTYEAQALATSLLANHWSSTNQRWLEGIGVDAESLYADAYGGLFALAVKDHAKAHQTIRHLRRMRVKNATIGNAHYSGPAVMGYRPYGELGANAHPSPPSIVDHAGTWAAVLFKARYGEPTGADIASLLQWNSTVITNDSGLDLYGARFLSYSADDTTTPYDLRGRPAAGPAAWAALMAAGASDLLLPDPPLPPAPSNLGMTCYHDYDANRLHFRYFWSCDPDVPACSYEAHPQCSVDGGSTWSDLSPSHIFEDLVYVRDETVGPNGFSAIWTAPIPGYALTKYRIQLRVRNLEFGEWAISEVLVAPAH
jgi:hypothetical protein